METEGKCVIEYCNSDYKTTTDTHIFNSCAQGAPKNLGLVLVWVWFCSSVEFCKLPDSLTPFSKRLFIGVATLLII